MILGTGTLTRIEPGLMQGEASFDVRGTFALRLDCLGRDCGRRIARLRVGNDIGRVTEAGTTWRGDMKIDGYPMGVRLIPATEAWAAEFHDSARGAV